MNFFIYTFPERNFFIEIASYEDYLQFRLSLVKGEFNDSQLCWIDENHRAYVFDNFGIPEKFHPQDEKIEDLLKNLLEIQMEKRKKILFYK